MNLQKVKLTLNQNEHYTRQKLSLKNLLNLDMDTQFRSMNLTSTARPKTMYTQRQLKIFSQDRMKLMSQKQLRRGNSQQISRPRLASAEFTPQQKAEKTKLKHSLGKVNLLAQAAIQVDQQDRIRSIYTLLQCLSRTQNFYRKAFNYIYESFGEIVYIKELPYPRERLQFVAQRTKSEMLSNFVFMKFDYTMVSKLALSLLQTLDKQLIKSEEYQTQVQNKFVELQDKLQEKSSLIKKLTGQINFYEDHPSKQQYGYINELEAKVANVENDLKRARAHIRELENSEEYLNQYNNMLSQKVEELRVKLYEFEMQQFSSMKEVQKNSELKEFQRNVEFLKDLIHKGALRMASMREEYNKIEAYNNELLGERSVLAKRAAVGFAELTPRPNYKKIFQQQGLNVNELIPAHLKPTTEQLVTSLIKCFKEFYNRYVQSSQKLQFQTKNSKEVHKDPGSLILKEIEKMSKQMKRTENAAEQVKYSYDKQKDDMNKKKRK